MTGYIVRSGNITPARMAFAITENRKRVLKMKMIDPKAKSNLLYVSQEAFDQMQQIPTVDAEPVVRCCDCKHMRCFSIGRQWCDLWEEELFILDGFCFYGDRKAEA